MELIAELTPIRGTDGGAEWRPRVFGAAREDGTWAAWLQFTPVRGDGPVMHTSVETTQPNRDAVAYWSTGLEDIYLEGALGRASSRIVTAPEVEHYVRPPRPVCLRPIDLYVLEFARRNGTGRVAVWRLFAEQIYTSSDLVRSIEHLEHDYQMVRRLTDDGTEWLELTEPGATSLEIATACDESSARPL